MSAALPDTSTHLLTLEDLAPLARQIDRPAETLLEVCGIISRKYRTDVCSMYLLEPDRANLVLAATVGLRQSCIGTLHMALHEGLTGLVAEQVRPVAVADVSRHPRFKYFHEIGEEALQSFLGMPLLDRGMLQGVLVVQTVSPREFTDAEIDTLAAAANTLAPVVYRPQ